MKIQIQDDKGLRNDPMVQEYIKTGEVLTRRVQQDQLTEDEAQLQLVQTLNDLQRDQLQQDAYRAQIQRAYPATTTCQPIGGGQVQCTTF